MSTDLNPTLTVWHTIAPRVERAIRNATDSLDGYPTGAHSSSGDGTSRTEALAIVHAYGRELDGTMTGPTDPNGGLHRELDRAVMRLARLVDQLAPNNAAADHLATKASDACPPGCCESCFRDGGHRTPARTTGSRMCKWCQNLAATLAADMPPLMLVQRHNRGQRITDRDIRTATGGKR